MATLFVLQGPDKGRTFKTSEKLVLIGRGSDQIPLSDQTVSRQQAKLEAVNGGWVLTDLESANGTYVNGVRIQEPIRLKHGDQVRLGSSVLVYAGDESLEQVCAPNIPSDLVTLDAGSESDPSIMSSVPSSEDSVVMATPDAAHAVRAWNVMRELSRVIGSLLLTDELLKRVMGIVCAEVKVSRGIIFMRDEETDTLVPEVVQFHGRESRQRPGCKRIIASHTITNHVVESRAGVLCSNIISDKRFASGKSVQNLGMRSIICAPIMSRNQVLGLIHLDSPVTQHTYNEHELRLITAIGYQTGLAIENARLVQSHLQRERLAAAGETVAYLSHSIKNILQGMRSGAEIVQRGLDARSLAKAAQGWGVVDRNLEKCYNLMLNMLAFSKEREPRLELLRLNKIVGDVVALAQKQADHAKVVLLADLEENIPPIPLDYDGIHQVLLNLVLNAIDAVPKDEGVVNIRAGYDSDGKHVVVTVADNGPGVPLAERTRVFGPFHSTKGHGGTGLGLAVANKIVREINGEIELKCPPGGGAEFIVRLPVSQPRLDDADDTRGGPA
ncbi:MAG: FHA domain-containing protein [Planctomycetes bacterium]|nr:FHA domain-containing protein [Planctomycetota bacterium]